jgi:hypothetical protein
MLALLLFASPSAHAADLDLRLTLPNTTPVNATWPGVVPGPLPPLVVADNDGAEFHLEATLSEDGDEHRIDFQLHRVEHRRRGGDLVTLVTAPTMVAPSDVWATFQMGGEYPVPNTTVSAAYFHGYMIDWSIRE